VTSADGIDIFGLARILIRYRLRSTRSAFRARGRGRTTLFAAIIAVVTAFLYVGLFAQAFSIVVTTVDLRGQLAVLALVTGTIALGSLAARAASSEAVRAGSPENEFYLARPVPLHTLVAARGLADAVTDPVGGLFLLPVLIAAALVWDVGPLGWPVAIAISMLTQIGISMLAYAVQLAVVRYVPSGRRRMTWTGLRLVAALSLAMLWMLGTWVMRAPAALATQVTALAPVLAFSPAMLVSAPLAALARGQVGSLIAALATLAAAVGAAMTLAVIVARRAGMAGWEEAGAVWADATRGPRPTVRLPTAATKDLRLIVRDRSQLLALIAMPAIFIGVQIFGAAGWSWTTASLGRISCFAYSLAVYMGTIGPLTHMQAERRAFWILRTVPVPLASLLAAKARAWAIIVGGIAALVFAVMSLSLHDVSIAERLGAGLLVTAGAAGMSFVAVAMASAGADLSDETGTAVGPATIYAYLFVGGLFNLVLLEGAATRLAGLALYAFAGWTYWQAGVEQAGFCLDAEAVRARRVRAADGATMLIACALGGHALVMAGQRVDPGTLKVLLAIQGGLLLVVGVAAVIYLARRPRALARAGLAGSLLLATGAGALAAGVVRAAGGAGTRLPAGGAALVIATLAIAALVEEIILRGIVQRGITEHGIAQPAIRPRGIKPRSPAPLRIGAAAISVVVGVVGTELALSLWALEGGRGIAAVAVVQTAAALTYAVSGRVTAVWLARVIIVAIASFT
jgi:hypothetical protein